MPRLPIDHFTEKNFRRLIVRMMVEWGNDPKKCGLCGSKARTVIHHIRYDGATIADLRFACSKCNNARENKFLD